MLMDEYTSPHWEKSALLTIDVQRDFSLPGAVFCIPGTEEALPQMKHVAEAYRAAGLPIIHIVRLYLSDGSNVDLCRRARIQNGLRIAEPGSSGSQIMEDLLPAPSVTLDDERLLAGEFQQVGPREWILYKPRFGAFYKTSLEEHLRNMEISTLVVAGCNFPNCPRTTIYEASERDFRVVLVNDAISGLYDRGVQEISNIGVAVLTADDVMYAVGKVRKEQATGSIG
jgi:nicotinamidase-related amidase